MNTKYSRYIKWGIITLVVAFLIGIRWIGLTKVFNGEALTHSLSPSHSEKQVRFVDPIQWQQEREEEVSKIIAKSLSHAEEVELSSGRKIPIHDRESAFRQMCMNISMVQIPSRGVELADYYVFTGGTSTEEITDFSSGIAVRKSDGKIFIYSKPRNAPTNP